jgi:hypothetical protein
MKAPGLPSLRERVICAILSGKSMGKPQTQISVRGFRIQFVFLALCSQAFGTRAQAPAMASCALEAPSFATSAPNIFNDRQEQDLGDALAEYTESDMRLAPPAADDELTRIGERLLATLPPTGIQYRFRMYESGEINGFSIAGGRVYISRKLIAAVKSEDELAGVVAHEIGHLSTHQTAIEMTRLLKIRIGVTSVSDRADVFQTVHRFLSTPPKENEEEGNETKDELVADHVALYAMVRAGFRAAGFPEFFNQISLNKGKTGNWLTDAFGITQENSHRYREALKQVSELPEGCSSQTAAADPQFEAWLHEVVEERVKNAAETAVGDKPLKLDPPLRPSPWRIRFSPDGKSILVQDEGSITVVDREAQKVLFQIDAPDAEPAQFAPDSASVVFNDSNLRVEKWSVATAQRTSVKELIVFDGCSQTLLAADGKTLACVKVDFASDTPRIGLRMIDVESGGTVFEKPAFFELGGFYSYSAVIQFALAALSGQQLVTMVSSADGRFLLAAAGERVLAYDMQQRQPVALGGKLKSMTQTNMTFVGSNELFFAGEGKGSGLRHGLLVSFPEGRVLKDIDIGDQSLQGVTRGDGVLAGPLKDYALALLDFDSNKFVAATKLTTMDAWDKHIAMDDPRGGLALEEIGSPDIARVSLPQGPMPVPRAASISLDGRYLALSLRNRAAVWQLDTGKQVFLMRPFRSGWIDNQDRLWGQYPKYGDHDPTETRLTLPTHEDTRFGKFDNEEWQYRDMQFQLKPMGNDKNTGRHATLEVKRMETQTVAWTRAYPHETPVCWSAEDDRMVLAWDLSNETAKDEIKGDAQLQHEAQALKNKNKGLLIETVNPETGAPYQKVLIPEADLTHGWDDERRAIVSSHFVLVRGEHDNTVIYQIETGAKVGEFFGRPLATDAETGLIAAINREDEILLVDERTGKEVKRFTLGSPARLARIVNEEPRTLLVLTADEVMHQIPLGN